VLWKVGDHLIIFQWGIWISFISSNILGNFCLDYLPMRNLNYLILVRIKSIIFTWLSSNEEFESVRDIKVEGGKLLLDYLPMRNLNILRKITKELEQILDYLPMRNLNCSTFSMSGSRENLIIFQWGIWMCVRSNQAFITLSLDYLPMRNLNTWTWFNLGARNDAWLSSNEEFE